MALSDHLESSKISHLVLLVKKPAHVQLGISNKAKK